MAALMRIFRGPVRSPTSPLLIDGPDHDHALNPSRRVGATFTMKACYQLLPPCLAVPSIQKKRLHVLVNSSHGNGCLAASTARLTHASKHNELRAAVDDNVKPWFSLFGMSFLDVYDEFPESIWDFLGESPETHRKKDQEHNRNKWSSDTDFDGRFAESIVFDKTLYKYGISGCKTNVHKIMNEGIISPSSRDEIIHSLERIEDDIELGKFDWKNGADVHTNIVEALSYEFGDLPKDLAVDSKYDSCLMILETWCKNNTDYILKQIKQLQVALVLLAIKNGGLVLPGNREGKDNTLIENLVLPVLKALDRDASFLCCILGFIYSSTDAIIGLRNMNRYPEVDLNSKRYMFAYFATSVNYRIPDHLKQLLEKLLPVKHLLSATQYDEATTYDTIVHKFSPDEQKREWKLGYFTLSKCLKTRFGDDVPQDCEIEHAKCHLFSSVKFVLEMLDQSIQFVEKMTTNPKKVQVALPRGYDDTIGFAYFLTRKGISLETAYALVHLCLVKQVQPSDLTLNDLRRINFPCERARGLLQDKGSVFSDFTCRDLCKEMLKWCCKLQICPETI